MVEVEVGDGQHLAAAVAHDGDRGGDERVPPAPVVVVGGGQHLVAAVARDDGRGMLPETPSTSSLASPR